MKKIIILSLFVASFISQAFSQGFSLNPRVVNTGASASNGTLVATSSFSNTTTDTLDNSFTWKIISLTLPNGWDLSSLCDPMNCTGLQKLYDSSQFSLKAGKNGVVSVDFTTSNNAGNAVAKVLFRSNKTQNTDTLTVNVKGWAAAVKETTKTKELTFFPNPAKDNLIIKYNVKEPITVEIYNVLGMRVKTSNLNSNESNIDISDLQNGVYFLRFKDDGKTISKSFTKAE